MPHIAATSSKKLPYRYGQTSLANTLKKYCMALDYDLDFSLIDSVFANTTIEQRYFALPLDDFYDPPTFQTLNSLSVEAAAKHATDVVADLLSAPVLTPKKWVACPR